MKHYDLFIDGAWVKSASEKYIAVENPSNEEVVGYVTDATPADVEKAMNAAAAAQKSWELLPIMERAKYVKRLAELLEGKKEMFARMLTMEQGKTYSDAIFEVNDTITYMTSAIEHINTIKGDIVATAQPNEMVTIEKVPYGVVAALCAWNYPLALVGRKIGPALITGNTVVLKPHELTPLATAEFFNLVEEAGFPKGVLNLITGTGAESGNLMVTNPNTRLVTVTGSVRAGQAIYRAAADNIAGLVLELGGKAPFVVMEDADIDKAVEAAVISRYANCGQVCICSDMVFVQESVAEEFTQKLLARVAKIKVGDPFDPTTEMGPKMCRQDLDKIDSIVKRSVEAGATIACGGSRPKGEQFEKGFWYEPTVLTNVTMDMPAAQEEIFGPVMPIIIIKDFDDALAKANSSSYGLACYLFTDDYRIIRRASREMEVGSIFVNKPIIGYFHVYHSGHKLSGLGGEDGEYGLAHFLQNRVMYIEY